MTQKDKRHDPPRQLLKRLVEETGRDLASLSRSVGRNHAYLHQYINRGTPRVLPEDVREHLGRILKISPDALRPRATATHGLSQQDAYYEAARDAPAYVEVVEMDVRASAGAGAVIEYDKTSHTWGFPESWVRSGLNARPNDIYIITIEGDSMPGVLEPGEKAVVNISDRIPSPPGVFLIHDGLGIVAKRIEHIDGSDPPTIRILSTNPAYVTYERTLEEAHILGRVVGKWQRL